MADTQHAHALGTLKPYAVEMKTARELLGKKARSEVYEAAALGKLDLVKDGAKTLVTLDSIERYQASWPRAVIKPSARRRKVASVERRQAKPPAGLAKPLAKAARAQWKKRGRKSRKTASTVAA